MAEAQNWAEGVRDCLLKIELWASHHNCEMERVKMEDVTSWLNVSPVPCNEPGHLKLKVSNILIFLIYTVSCLVTEKVCFSS